MGRALARRLLFNRHPRVAGPAEEYFVPKILTAVVLCLLSTAALASDGHPIPLKERLKIELWTQGIPEFESFIKRPMPIPLPDSLERTLGKLGL